MERPSSHKAYGNKTFNKGALTLEKKIYEGGTKTDAMDYFGNEKQKETQDSIIVNEEDAVSTDDYYDLASVTKVAASSLAIMQLMSEGKLRLDQRLGELVPSLQSTNKANLKMRDLLTHRAGLKAWIPFGTMPLTVWLPLKMPLMQNLHCWIKWSTPKKSHSFYGKFSAKKIRKYTITLAPLKKDVALGRPVWKQDLLFGKRCHLQTKKVPIIPLSLHRIFLVA